MASWGILCGPGRSVLHERRQSLHLQVRGCSHAPAPGARVVRVKSALVGPDRGPREQRLHVSRPVRRPPRRSPRRSASPSERAATPPPPGPEPERLPRDSRGRTRAPAPRARGGAARRDGAQRGPRTAWAAPRAPAALRTAASRSPSNVSSSVSTNSRCSIAASHAGPLHRALECPPRRLDPSVRGVRGGLEQRRHRLSVGDALDRPLPGADDALHVARHQKPAHTPAPDERGNEEQRAEREERRREPRVVPDHLRREHGAERRQRRREGGLGSKATGGSR